MARKKSNYEKLQARDYRDTMQGRDVNAEQDYDPGEGTHCIRSRLCGLSDWLLVYLYWQLCIVRSDFYLEFSGR